MNEITSKDKDQATAVIANDPFSRLIGMRLTAFESAMAEITIDMRDELRQPHGLLHGGVTATLIDTAMAFAVITVIDRSEKASTVDLNVHYLRPHKDGRIVCRAEIVKAGRRLLTVSADVFDEAGKKIATAIATYSKV